jgi:hypothetical protein
MAIKHLLDRDKIFTKELDPKKTKSDSSIEYEQNSKGSFIVDQNTNLENKRRLISLYTDKTTQKNFTQVVDIEFEEFVDAVVEVPVDNSTNIEDLSAENLTLQRKIDLLNTQVSQLEENIKNYPVVVTNIIAPAVEDTEQQVSDTMVVGSTLYSDRTGAPVAPGGSIQNMLLSKNRKSRLVIQGDGNLIIVTGEFDKQGNSLGPDEVVLAFGYDAGETAPSFFTVAWEGNQKINSYIAVGGLFPGYQHRWRTPGFKTSQQTKLVLDDYGNINLFDKDKIVWSSYGIDVSIGVVPYNRPTTINPNNSVTPPPPPPAPPVPVGLYLAKLKQNTKFTSKINNRTVDVNPSPGTVLLTIKDNNTVEFKPRALSGAFLGSDTLVGPWIANEWDLQSKIA